MDEIVKEIVGFVKNDPILFVCVVLIAHNMCLVAHNICEELRK